MHDLIRRHDGAHRDVPVRAIGLASTPILALEARQEAGAYRVPSADFHRFTIQFSGRQSFRSFEVDDWRLSPPAQATSGTISFVPTGRELRAVTEGDDFHGFRVLIPHRAMQRTVELVFGAAADEAAGLSGYVGAPTDRVYRLARLLHDEYRAPGPGDAAMMGALVDALSVELLRHFSISGRATRPLAGLSDADRARVGELMEAAVDRSLTLGDIADALGMEPFSLSRHFRASFGETPRRHLMRLRLARAKSMLVDGDTPLAEIGVARGFSSQSHMTGTFTREPGTSPARVRAA